MDGRDLKLRRFSLRRGDREWLLGLLGRADADELRNWAGNGFRAPLNRAQLDRHLARMRNPGRYAFIGQWTGAETERVSYVELYDARAHASAFLTRMYVAPAFRGQGLGTATVRRVIAVGFSQLKLHRIELNVYEHNTAARRCYEKAGFQNEGLLRDLLFTGTGYWSAYRMSILDHEWRTRGRGC